MPPWTSSWADALEAAAARVARHGTSVLVRPADLTDDALRVEVETKVLFYLRCARAVAPHMAATGWGRIVNVSGLNAQISGSLVGSVRNVAVAARTKNLADELALPASPSPSPGTTVTERTPAMLAERAARDGVPAAEVARRLAAATSIGRLVTAEEVADVITFLASPRSAAITGDAIAVGGGTRGSVHS